MADFSPAIDIVFANEGGFNKNLKDGEGMTYRGLTIKSDSDWSGWAYINNYIAQNGYPADEHIFPELEQSVKDYYQNNQNSYWQRSRGDALINQDMANFVFSFFVSSGYAGKEVNIAINKAMGSKVVPENNTLSDAAVDYMNNNQDTIYPVLYQQREDYLHSLATWGRFGKSWERMMAMFPANISVIRVMASKTGYEGVMGGIGFILVGTFGYLAYRKGLFNFKK